MSISIDGNSLVISDVSLTFPEAFNPASGVAHIVITPAGGLSSLPVAIQGAPGLPPVIDSVTVTQLPYGTTLPSPDWTLVSAGSAGVASHYTLNLYVNSGATGPSGTFAIASGTDLSGTATSGYLLACSGTSPTAFTYAAPKVGDLYTSSVTTYSSLTTSSQTIATLTVPAQPWSWRPRIDAQVSLGGTANTLVDLAVNAVTGSNTAQVGYGYGVSGATSSVVTATPNNVGASVSATVIPASTAATFNLLAKQLNSTADAWSVNGSRAAWSVQVCPVP